MSKLNRKALRRMILNEIMSQVSPEEAVVNKTTKPKTAVAPRPDLEKEPAVETIKQRMKQASILADEETGKRGLLSYVDQYDEFEDFIRLMIHESGLPNKNKMIYPILVKIAKDFRDNPDTAVGMSDFNLATGIVD